MVEQTLKLKAKGYTIDSFLKKIGFGITWYRNNIKESGPSHELLNRLIDEAEDLK